MLIIPYSRILVFFLFVFLVYSRVGLGDNMQLK